MLEKLKTGVLLFVLLFIFSCSNHFASLHCPDFNKKHASKNIKPVFTGQKFIISKNNKQRFKDSRETTEPLPFISPVQPLLALHPSEPNNETFITISPARIDSPPAQTQKDTVKTISDDDLSDEIYGSRDSTPETNQQTHKQPNEDFTWNIILSWLLTFLSLVLIFLAIIVLFIPILSLLLIIAAMFVSFEAVERAWEAFIAKGVGASRIAAVPPLIISGIIALLLIIIVAIISH